MWAATGSVASKAPSLVDIRRGSFGAEGWDERRQKEHRHGSQESNERPANNRKGSSGRLGVEPFPALTEERPSFDTRERAPQYDGQNDVSEARDGAEPRTSHFTDKSDESAVRQPLNVSSQVRDFTSLMILTRFIADKLACSIRMAIYHRLNCHGRNLS